MRFVFTALLLLATFAHAAERPQDVVERFYTIHVAGRPSGLPDGKELEKLAPLFSERLHALIVNALKYRDAMMKEHPDDKPPYVDGDMFTSVFEGPRAFKILGVDGDKVRVQFSDEPNITWQDTILVKEENGHYVIDDILFGGLGDFNPPGRLTDRLRFEDVSVSVEPQPAYIAADASGQALSVDLIVENHTDEALDLDQIQISVFDREDKLVLRRFIDGNGARPSIRTADVPEIAAGATTLVFNPFHEFAPDVDLHKVQFDLKLSSKDGKRRYAANATVNPVLYRAKVKLILPLAKRMIVYDGHDFYAHHRRWDYTIPALQHFGFRTNFMRYSYDFVPVDDAGNMSSGDEAKNESWPGFGQPIRAVADGIVAAVIDKYADDRTFDPSTIATDGTMKIWGNYVVIDHGNGEHSLYGHIHQNSSRVKAGQRVRRGETIAAIGAAGSSLFPHLHFEMQTGPDTNAEGLPSVFEDFDRILGSKRVRVKSGRVNSGDIVQSR